MAKMKLQIPNFDALAKQLTDLGGDVKKASEDALKETHRIVTDKLLQVMVPSNMPSKNKPGQYWTGRTRDSIVMTPTITWDGTKASVDVGFDIDNGGLTSIFLMYGTPKMAPVPGLYDAIYGKTVQAEIVEAQREIVHNAIIDAMGGSE